MIVIFDNFLVLANDYDDLFNKVSQVLARCKQYGLILKMPKSFLGFPEAKFFGYRVSQDGFELTEERKQAILDIPFPTTLKQAQRFIGCTIFFSKFVHHFATELAPLSDMT